MYLMAFHGLEVKYLLRLTGWTGIDGKAG